MTDLLIRNSQTIFQNSRTISHAFRLCKRVPVPPYPHRRLTVSAFLISVTLAGVKWYLDMGLDSEILKSPEYLLVRSTNICQALAEHQAPRQTQLHVKTAVSWNVQFHYQTNIHEPLNHRGLKGMEARRV